jgi:hypothetical protein
MLNSVVAKYLPMPTELSNAVGSGHVRIQYRSDGSALYFVKSDCPNVGEVRQAIAQRKKWELAISFLEGVMLAVAFAAACIALVHF